MQLDSVAVAIMHIAAVSLAAATVVSPSFDAAPTIDGKESPRATPPGIALALPSSSITLAGPATEELAAVRPASMTPGVVAFVASSGNAKKKCSPLFFVPHERELR